VIIAQLATTDPGSAVDTSRPIYLSDTPFPGDTVLTAGKQRVRVIRREFLDHGRQEKEQWANVDVLLMVRMVGPCDG
jgi:hypothetical protein